MVSGAIGRCFCCLDFKNFRVSRIFLEVSPARRNPSDASQKKQQ